MDRKKFKSGRPFSFKPAAAIPNKQHATIKPVKSG